MEDVEDSLEILAEEPRVGPLRQLRLVGLVAHLLPARRVVLNLVGQVALSLHLANSCEDGVVRRIRCVLVCRHLVVDDFHCESTARVPESLNLEAVLELHDLVGRGALLRLVDKTRVE